VAEADAGLNAMAQMSEMVERVARAIYDAGQMRFHTEPWDTRIAETQENYRALARAAITALREPIEAMMSSIDWSEYEHEFGPAEARLIWETFIDAALKD
jgi:hypothetical protein